MKTQKWIFNGMVIVACILFGFSIGHAKSYKYMTILAAGTGGVYYPLSGGIADILTKKKISSVSAEATGGSVENCTIVGRGRAEMGFTMGDAAYDAYNGIGKFEQFGKQPVLAMFSVYPSPMHILVLDKSKITQIADVKGQKISVGAFGSGTENMAKNMLEAVGISYGDIKPAFLSFSETSMGLRDGVVDAGFMAVAIPASAVLDLGSTRKVRFVPLSETEIKQVIDKYPYYSSITIPENGYSGIGGIVGDTPGVGVQNLIICHKDLPNDLVYNMVKAIFENQPRLVEVHQIATQMTLENAVKVPIPLHPGAEKYFKEAGAIKAQE